ncbi:alpha/beta fold hydrolase [Nonomuraea rubra]|uniref:Pimeloyl-ACP methyl ester carboxylesterase n=2 Tax=Nonomuraea rubra TaxID=46180 RepID=A0A7X0TY87_9ACTN|nr:alpha/beta hydrolase [Nonomuraea rubra]MBB6548173.1 pimeloyl-ACP methyl ester carboxylesterase [Nonomuraea rubra]
MIIRVVLALALSAPPVMTPAGAPQSPCPVPVPARTSCGFLEVPERRDAPERKIKVGYAVHLSTAADREPDPVVYMSGGPGSASMQLMGFLSQMFPDRDVVTVEQRGSRYSQPSLACPETAQALLGRLRQPPADVGAAANRCRERLAEQGVDLRGYNTKEIAADVVALRQKLGYASWNLFGVSYSTRVMTEVAAADPEGVRSVVLDSYLPAGVAWYDDAGRNLGDTMALLGVRERYEAMLARLNRTPALVPVLDPLAGREFTARMTGDDVATILAETLHEAEVAAVMPAMVGALAEGRDEVLRPLADAVGEGLTSHEFGLYHAVQCQDEVPFNTFSQASRLFTVNADKAVCDAWRLPKTGAAATDSGAADSSTADGGAADGGVSAVKAPAYVLAGQYDPTTPPRTAGPAAEALPAARFQQFPGLSHAVFLASACARREIAGFVGDPARHAPAPCPAPELRPGGLHVTGAPYRISQSPWLAAPLALYALAALIQLVTAALRGRAPAAFGGLAGVAFTGVVAQAVLGLASRNETALAVGLPDLVVPYSSIAVVSAILSAAALYHDRRWPQIAATVISGGFLVWWFTWVL